MSDTDALIVGAGPGGLAMALALRRAGVERVLILDRPRRSLVSVGETATPDVRSLLKSLGVQDELEALGHKPCYGNLSLWGGELVFDDFLRRGQGHGLHVNREAMDAQLLAAAKYAGARVLAGTVANIVRDGELWRVIIEDAQHISAPVVVDAGGRCSPLATRLGATRRRMDELVGLAVTVSEDHAQELAGLSVIEPFEHGWWYAAQLAQGGAVVMLVTDADIVKAEQLQLPSAFYQAWAETLEVRRRVSLPRSALTVRGRAAQTGFLDRAAGPGWLALGDALMSLDPLTSSGISNALRDGLAGAEVVSAWLRGEDPAVGGRRYGARANLALKRYWVERTEQYSREVRWADAPFWRRRAWSARELQDSESSLRSVRLIP